jgi:hypothetical protein
MKLLRLAGMFLALATLSVAQSSSLPSPAQTPAPTPEADGTSPNATAPAGVPLPNTYTFPTKTPNPNLDPSIAPPPLPSSRIALIGGTVREIDPIRNRMKVQLFGGGKMNFIFDSRTKVTSNGAEFIPSKIRKGDRVYLDTQNVNGTLFARRIQVNNKTEPTELRGQVASFDAGTGEMRIYDAVSASHVPILVTQQTEIRSRNGAGQLSQLQPGAYVAVRFQPSTGAKNEGQQVNIIVAPGESFRFIGTVRNLDLSSGYLSVENKVDDTLYELRASPEELRAKDVTIGTDVDLSAMFNGRDYLVHSMNVMQPATAPATTEDEK